jgi:flagellar FliL protein
MATDDNLDAPDGGLPVAKAPAPKKQKKLVLALAGAAAILIGGGGATYALTSKHKASASKTAASDGASKADTFIDVPAMTVNLRSTDGTPKMLKVHFVLVPAAGVNAEAMKKRLPLLLDAYQPFLRELRPEDLAGSAAVFRIKEEMLVRASQTLGADQVSDVLIQDLIQQ